jgi:hypothetical protein
MKIIDFKLRAPRGTYYGAHPTAETAESILDFLSDHKVPNPITEKLLHCTVIYSRVWCTAKALGDLDPHWEGDFDAYNVWPTHPKENEEQTNCLTLSFVCPEMHKRHQDLRKEGATHDYPDFKPHLTLSYDVGDKYDHLKESLVLPHYKGPLAFHHEYSEPLNLDFVKSKVNK